LIFTDALSVTITRSGASATAGIGYLNRACEETFRWRWSGPAPQS
jgi:hypothetical protein